MLDNSAEDVPAFHSCASVTDSTYTTLCARSSTERSGSYRRSPPTWSPDTLENSILCRPGISGARRRDEIIEFFFTFSVTCATVIGLPNGYVVWYSRSCLECSIYPTGESIPRSAKKPTKLANTRHLRSDGVKVLK